MLQGVLLMPAAMAGERPFATVLPHEIIPDRVERHHVHVVLETSAKDPMVRRDCTPQCRRPIHWMKSTTSVPASLSVEILHNRNAAPARGRVAVSAAGPPLSGLTDCPHDIAVRTSQRPTHFAASCDVPLDLAAAATQSGQIFAGIGRRCVGGNCDGVLPFAIRERSLDLLDQFTGGLRAQFDGDSLAAAGCFRRELNHQEMSIVGVSAVKLSCIMATTPSSLDAFLKQMRMLPAPCSELRCAR
jgi:hypothetical protein